MSAASSAGYAVVQTKDLVETHRLVDGDRDAEVVVAPVRGGMVTRFRVGADDILFLDHATLRDHTQNVRGGIPILFPFAGRLTDDAFVLAGQRIVVPQHGFARKLPWRIAATGTEGAASITLVLEHSESTLQAWPFPFRLRFQYALRDAALTISQRYENLGDRPMPIHPGLHPYFRVDDWSKRQARIETAATRAFDNRTGAPRVLVGPIELGSGEVDLQLLDHGTTHVRLTRPGASAVDLSYDRAETVVTVWSLPSRDFVCVEPWTRPSDAVNHGQALEVPPGGGYETHASISPRFVTADTDVVDISPPRP
jgi:galactose mutarotase-like enzyme